MQLTTALPDSIVALLQATRPDVSTWASLTRALDAAALSPQQLADVKKALSSWPREVPRKAPKAWTQGWRDDQARAPSCPRLKHHDLLSLCLEVAETESLYNYYIGAISTSPRLRLRDGSPAVTLWRQLRGRVQLQNGTSLALGDGQLGLADLGGIMTVEWDAPCFYCGPPRQFHSCLRDSVDYTPRRLNLYVEIEVKIDGKVPPQAREYKGDSSRQLTDTEREQVQRQQAQTQRGGFYGFHDRVDEAVSALCRYRDDVVARLS